MLFTPRRPGRRGLILALGLIASCLPASLPGAARLPERFPVVMQLDWIHNAQFAGIYQAIEQGYFADAGFSVEVRPVDREMATVAATVEAGAAFGSAESNVLLVAHANGAPVRAVATMFQDSPMGWMSLKSTGITSLADFPDHRIGIHPDGEKVFDLILSEQPFGRGDLTFIKVGWDPQIVADGEVDLMQAYAIDEFVRLQLMTGGGARILMAKDHGYQAYSQVVFTTETMTRNHPEKIGPFLKALREGWTFALGNIESTVDLIREEWNPELDRDYQIASLEAIGELVSPRGRPPLAPMSRQKWEASQRDFVRAGIIEEPTDLDELLDFRFNPQPAAE